jgi:hypothetical protein
MAKRETFPARRLRAKPGTISGHVFENPSVGIERDLFWSISVPFEPIEYQDEEVRPLLQCDWIVWPLARWRDLAGMKLTEVKDARRFEASFYVYDHSELAVESLELAARKRGGFELFLRGCVDFLANDGAIEPFPIEIETPLALEDVRIVPANLRRGPRTASEAAALLGKYLEPADFLEPEWDGFCYQFRPKEEAPGL